MMMRRADLPIFLVFPRPVRRDCSVAMRCKTQGIIKKRNCACYSSGDHGVRMRSARLNLSDVC